MEIKITKKDPSENEDLYPGFYVEFEGKTAEGLGYDEMIGLVVSIAMPEQRPCLQWLKTPEQIESEKARHKKAMENNKSRKKTNAEALGLVIQHIEAANPDEVGQRIQVFSPNFLESLKTIYDQNFKI